MNDIQRITFSQLQLFGLYNDVANIIYQYCAFAGSLREQIEGTGDFISCIAVFPNGDLCRTFRGNMIQIWRDGICKKTLVCNDSFINSLAIGNDGILYTGSPRDGKINLWKDGTCIRTLRGYSGARDCLVILPNGDVCSGSADGTIKTWKFVGNDGGRISSLKCHLTTITRLVLLPNGDLCSGSSSRAIKIWRNNVRIQTLSAGNFGVSALVVLPNGNLCSGSYDGKIKIWKDGKCILNIENSAAINTFVVMPNGDLCSGDSHGEVKVFRIDNTSIKCILTLEERIGFNPSLLILKDGSLCGGSCSGTTIKIWE